MEIGPKDLVAGGALGIVGSWANLIPVEFCRTDNNWVSKSLKQKTPSRC